MKRHVALPTPHETTKLDKQYNATQRNTHSIRGLRIAQNAPHPAFRFETPAVSPETVSRQNFEFVLVRDDYLVGFAKTPNPRPFAKFLSVERCGGGSGGDDENENGAAGCVFENLGGDATLVAPKDWSPLSLSSSSSSSWLSKPSNELQQQSQQSVSSCYGHLANFVRGAPDVQIAKLWNLVAETLEEQLMGGAGAAVAGAAIDRPLWWSTAGTGVAWLHFRLDSRPKYYQYRPYKAFAKPLGRDRLLGMDILLGDRKRNAGGNG